MKQLIPDTMRLDTEKKKISVILPTLNECDNVQLMYDALMIEFRASSMDYEIIFVDDNSSDGTIDRVRALSSMDDNVKYLLMSKRFGDQVCLMAGLDYASGDAAIIMDSDLQHPPKYIPEMVSKWREGVDVVVMQRESAGHSSWLKEAMEVAFYKVLNWISDENIYFRFSGFSLLDKKVVSNIKKFKIKKPKIRVLGLNPHAGENGYLGDEEITTIIPVINKLKKAGLNLKGPAPADTAFTPDSLKNIDVVLAMFHDQGLPVLKAMGFKSAANITLGLPFIRTSVDHGTALDLAGTGNISLGSFETALSFFNTLSGNVSQS